MDPVRRIAVVYNSKIPLQKGDPEDMYAECDDVSVPKAIKFALETAGYEADILEADVRFYGKIAAGGYDFVFNIAEGTRGASRESQVPAMLEALGIPYTGSDVLTQAITLDKRRTKEILLYHGISTPRYQFFRSWNARLREDLRFPLIVKPNAEGSSKGIINSSLVRDEFELRAMLKFVLKTYKQPALVEEFLEGREFTVALLGNRPLRVMPIVEVKFDELPASINRLDSFEVKWIWDHPDNPIDSIICPAKITRSLEKAIRQTALRSFTALDLRDLCRIDMRLDDCGVPHVLDVNALPGLIPDPAENSRFPKACFATGMSYEEIILTILVEAQIRYGLMKRTRTGAENGASSTDRKPLAAPAFAP